jgi:tRNA threonylcarbamoyladenosine biosynthesis protein TsaE
VSEAFELQITSEQQMHDFGMRLGSLLAPGDVLSLNGPLGAGKTTLTRGIGEGVVAQGNISSPTFLIARTHQTASGVPFVHLDAYRLATPAELDDLDVDFANSISVIEWGRGFAEGLSEQLLEIDIDRKLQSEVRDLRFRGSGRFAEFENFIGGGE